MGLAYCLAAVAPVRAGTLLFDGLLSFFVTFDTQGITEVFVYVPEGCDNGSILVSLFRCAEEIPLGVGPFAVTIHEEGPFSVLPFGTVYGPFNIDSAQCPGGFGFAIINQDAGATQPYVVVGDDFDEVLLAGEAAPCFTGTPSGGLNCCVDIAAILVLTEEIEDDLEFLRDTVEDDINANSGAANSATIDLGDSAETRLQNAGIVKPVYSADAVDVGDWPVPVGGPGIFPMSILNNIPGVTGLTDVEVVRTGSAAIFADMVNIFMLAVTAFWGIGRVFHRLGA